MTPQEIINVIKAFFDAITKILVALGIIKEEADA